MHYKVYYQPNKFTIYQYGAISICFSKSSQILIIQIWIIQILMFQILIIQILIIQILIWSCVVFMWNTVEKPESFVPYVT